MNDECFGDHHGQVWTHRELSVNNA